MAARKAAKPANGAPAAELAIEHWPIDRPKPYGKNPRKISDRAVDKVANSIMTFGFRQPIVVDKDGVIVVGHVRYRAAQKLERKTVPVHVAKDLTPAQAKAYRLADNRVGDETEWLDDLLAEEFSGLELLNFDLEFTGFDKDEIDLIMKGWESDIEALRDKHGENEDGIRPLIKLRVDQANKEQALDLIEDTLQKAGIEYEVA